MAGHYSFGSVDSNVRSGLLDFEYDSRKKFSKVTDVVLHVKHCRSKQFLESAFDVNVLLNVVVVVYDPSGNHSFVSVFVITVTNDFIIISMIELRSGSCCKRYKLLTSSKSLSIEIIYKVSYRVDSSLPSVIVAIGNKYGIPVGYENFPRRKSKPSSPIISFEIIRIQILVYVIKIFTSVRIYFLIHFSIHEIESYVQYWSIVNVISLKISIYVNRTANRRSMEIQSYWFAINKLVIVYEPEFKVYIRIINVFNYRPSTVCSKRCLQSIVH